MNRRSFLSVGLGGAVLAAMPGLKPLREAEVYTLSLDELPQHTHGFLGIDLGEDDLTTIRYLTPTQVMHLYPGDLPPHHHIIRAIEL